MTSENLCVASTVLKRHQQHRYLNANSEQRNVVESVGDHNCAREVKMRAGKEDVKKANPSTR